VLITRLLFRYNDGGRKAAGLNPTAGDCVARSVAIVAQLPYAVVHGELAELNARMRKTSGRLTAGHCTADLGIYITSKLFKDYVVRLGFVWTPTMKVGSGSRVHLRPGELPKGRLVVSVTRQHYTAVIDGTVHDTGDPCRGGTRCDYGYWRKL